MRSFRLNLEAARLTHIDLKFLDINNSSMEKSIHKFHNHENTPQN